MTTASAEIASSRTEITPEEYRQRAAAVTALASERGLDAILAWAHCGGTVDRYANVLYLTNYYNPWPAVPDTTMWTGQGQAAVLVTREGERILLTNVPEIEWRHSYVHCDDFVDDPHLDRGLVTVLARRGLEASTIGVAGMQNLSAGLYERLRRVAPCVHFVPADDVLFEARRIKSPAELEVIRHAARAGCEAMTAMLDRVEPGARQREVQTAGVTAALSAGMAFYDSPASSGPWANAFAPAGLPSWPDRVLQPGDLWRVDLYATWHGYLVDFSRTTVVGEPSPVQRDVLEACVYVVETIVERLSSGMRFSEVYNLGAEALRAVAPWRSPSGQHDYPHFGHTIGLGWEDLWITPTEHRAIVPGTYLAVEVALSHPTVGLAMVEDDLIVTAEGVEVLTSSARKPWSRAC